MTTKRMHLHARLTQRRKGILNAMLLTILTLCVGTAFAGEKITISNPYDGVSWAKEHRHKANFHTHTTASDGKIQPQDVVDGYKKLGYSALAITDHDRVTYPWTEFTKIKPAHSERVSLEERTGYEDRDPEKVGMTSVQGNEISRSHHIVNLWTDTPTGRRRPDWFEIAIDDSKKKGGQMIFAHPGRWGWERNETRKNKPNFNGWTVERYVGMFKEHTNFIGLEVYNAGDKYPMDRRLWDAVLKELMPDRPVWGFSNDDMHRPEQMGRNQSILLVKEPTQEKIKEALAKGQFFYAYVPKAQEGSKPPTIETITVDDEKSTITLNVDGAEKIEWISDGKVVGTEPALGLTKVEELGSYVRAMVYGAEETVIGTQPFGILRKE